MYPELEEGRIDLVVKKFQIYSKKTGNEGKA